MSGFTEVFFKGLSDSMNIPSVLADFTIFGRHLVIHMYGAIIAFGFLLAVLLGGRIAYTWKMSLDKMVDVLIYGTIAGIIGARLYYVFSSWDYYGKHPADIFKIWEGGLAIYGGLIAGVIAAYVVCKKRKMNFLNLLDCCAISFLVGQGIGRWGNFVNQEAFGTNTNMPWGMYSQKTFDYLSLNYDEITARGIEVNPSGYVHPTFLYESIWCLIGVAVLYAVCRKYRRFSGQMILWYGVWYGAERAVVEGFRTDSLYLGSSNIRISQLISIVLAAVCLVLLVLNTIKYKRNPREVEGVEYYIDDKGNRVKKAKIYSKKTAAPAQTAAEAAPAVNTEPGPQEKPAAPKLPEDISASAPQESAAEAAETAADGNEESNNVDSEVND